MSNLVEELGARYVSDFCSNAVFVMGNRLYRLIDASNDILHVQHINLNTKQMPLRWSNTETLSHDVLKDFSTLRYPKLGYRQMDHNTLGKLVVHITGHRSTQRGFRSETCRVVNLPVYDLFPDYASAWLQQPHCQVNKHIFAPEFTPFAEGIQQLMAGNWPGFAMSEDVAIGMSVHTEANRGFDIYFRGRVVGNVDSNGTVNISSSILKRDSIKRKLFR